MKGVILIGGAPGAGKSTVAEELAKHFQIPWVSTDQIRRILRPTETDETKKTELIWEGTSAFLHGIRPWNEGIVEGAAILPGFIARDLKDIQGIKPIFLIQSESQIIRIIEARSKLPYINTKTPEQQAEKVKRVSELNAVIREEAQQYGYSCVEAHREDTFAEVLKVLSGD
jgi:2-phosphoglycerate kinase